MRGKKSIIFTTKSETLNVIEHRSTFAIAITQRNGRIKCVCVCVCEGERGNGQRYANREVIIVLLTVGLRLNRPLRSRASNFTLAIPAWPPVQHPANRIFEALVITVSRPKPFTRLSCKMYTDPNSDLLPFLTPLLLVSPLSYRSPTDFRYFFIHFEREFFSERSSVQLLEC